MKSLFSLLLRRRIRLFSEDEDKFFNLLPHHIKKISSNHFYEVILYPCNIHREVLENSLIGIKYFYFSFYLSKHNSKKSRELKDLLIYAASKGKLKIVKFLVLKGIDIHYNHDLPLRNAVLNNRLEVVKYFVSQGANILIYKLNLFAIPENISQRCPEMFNYLISL